MTGDTTAAGHPPREPIAVIGIGCRFPGGADDPESYWRNLVAGVDAIRRIPDDRWTAARFFDPRPGVPGKTYTERGGFLERIDQFEPECFGIAPREAPTIDPQQRLLLEVAWEAMQDAGQRIERLSGSPTGVFVGISTTDYANIQSTIDDLRGVDAHTATGGAFSIAANRISYCFDLKGPSIAVDTACSSSLTAVHLACGSIWGGESGMALAGGVNVILTPATYVAFSAATMLSRSGLCRAFDADADGFVRGEGAGMVLLKPLSRALSDGDRIYATILATAANQDGRTPGIAVPDPAQQEALLREACRRAGVEPREIQYIEAHGTGTPVGDPIEANAIGRVVSAGRPAEDPCLIGSVKTQIGHLEAGAGIAGLIKAALAIHNRRIPPNRNFARPNPHVRFDELRLRVPVSSETWPHERAPLLAGVNAFGFGGANAHVLLRDPPSASGADLPAAESPRVLLLPITARSPEALEQAARSYREHLAAVDPAAGDDLADICHTASVRRDRLDHGLSIAARGREELLDRLDAFLAGEKRPGMFTGRRTSGKIPPIVFAFCGQGPQWWRMGRGLLESEPVFREMVTRCDALLSEHADWSLLEELTADEAVSRMQRTAIAQPALFAIQVALAELWKSWGIEPDAVIGHSVGEIAAAYVAGILPLPEAAWVVFHRGRTMDQISSRGQMIAAALSVADAAALIAGREERVAIAAANSPHSVTLSGYPDAVEELADLLVARNVWHRFLKVEYAFHSPLMDPVREDLLASLGSLEAGPARIPMISTVTGKQLDGDRMNGEYWWRGLRHRVCFAEGMDDAIERGFETFLEIGPHPVLSGYMAECFHARGVQANPLPSLRREEDERAVMLASLGALYVIGRDVRWGAVFPGRRRTVRLPVYPWRREIYWHEPAALRDSRLCRDLHPLLSREMRSADPTWQTFLDLRTLPFLSDHRVEKHVVFPGAAFVEMAASAARRAHGLDAVQVEEIQFLRALFLSGEGGDAAVQIRVDREEGAFEIHGGIPGGAADWTLHCRGYLGAERVSPPSGIEDPLEIRRRLPERLDAAACYARFAEIGLHYGPAFQGIREIHRRDGEALGEIELPEGLEGEGYLCHPALLDACFQVVFGAVARGALEERRRLFLPVYIRRVIFLGTFGRRVSCRARVTRFESNVLEADLDLYDDGGRLAGRVEGFRCQALDRARAADEADPRGWLYELRWENKAHAAALEAARPAGFLPGVRELADAALAEGHALAARLGLTERAAEVDRSLNRIALAFIVRFLRGAGVALSRGERIDEAALAERLDLALHHQRLLHRFLLHLRDRGDLRPLAEGEWEVTEDAPAEDPEVLWRDVWARHPAYASDLILLGRCGSAIGNVLRGEVNPLQIFFPDGPTTTLATLYQSSPTFLIGNRMAQAALRRIQDSLPEGRILRVLEVGAGTGGLTAELLPVLRDSRASYTFTDVSPSFLAKAEQRFGAYPFVRFRTLDVEMEPRDQGFTPMSFDLIVASDVVHATADVRRTLAHLRSLMSPGGVLLLIEAERKSPFPDVVFGLTEGWWRYQDVELRPDHPLLGRDLWKSVLETSGYESPEALPYHPGETESLQIVILARNPMTAAVPAPTPIPSPAPAADADPPAGAPDDGGAAAPDTWLLFEDRSGVGRGLRSMLEARGDRCLSIECGDRFAARGDGRYAISPERPEEMDAIFEAWKRAGGALAGAIHLWSLDAEDPDGPSPEPLRRGEVLGCHSVLHLVQSLQRIDGPVRSPRLLLVTRGAQPTREGRGPISISQAPLLGVGRVLLNEHPDLRTKLVDLDRDGSAGEIEALFDELWTEDPEEELAIRRESRLVPRAGHVRAERVTPAALGVDRAEGSGFHLTASTGGAIDALAWREARRREPGPGEVEIRIESAGLNFRDVLKALALYPAETDDDLLLGDECAGRVTAIGSGVEGLVLGDAVVTMAPGCFASRVTVPATAVLRKPARLTFEEAATIPVTFLTAHYALNEVARLRPGESVLVHSGAGGVGMAAIQIARRAGARVFATAGGPEKREILRLMGVDRVMDSRSLAFADEVMEATNGRGVDVVLNALAGKAIGKGLSCMAPFGRFLELGKRDIYQNSRIGLWAFRRNISFHAIDLGRVAREDPSMLRRMFQELMDRFEAGDYHPLPHTIHGASRAVDAFRHVAQGRHVGKLVLSMNDPDLRVERTESAPVAFRGDATYLITGGLGGFGLVVAKWIIERGGRHLLLLGRRGAETEEAQAAVRELESLGARVVVARADVVDADSLAAVLDSARRDLPPLRGIFHAAMVLDDGILLQLDRERFARVLGPKVTGTWNLHHLTLEDPIETFVLFSSVSSWVGTPGQGNYVAANAFLDAFAYHRRFLGLPVLTVNWGRLDEVGYVSRHSQVSEILTRRGFIGFSPAQAMAGLDRMLPLPQAQLGFLRLDWGASTQSMSKMRVARRVAALFGELAVEREADAQGARVRAALKQAKPDERAEILRDYIRGEVARVLGASAAKLDPDRPLNQMGFDSLMAVELKNHIDTDLALSLPTGALMEAPTIHTLAAAVLDLAEGRTPAARTAPAAEPAPAGDGTKEPSTVS
jgi:acyl transferase domain-containing protein/NADPH:quinone reductase-like Zn-dependent oxidoreductase/SAM-dependent methyltransferase/acyl carrier protein